ncbi:hypothetical protein Q7C_674 [Methylophaga frappieri]|uniref:DUF2007 domain-containing protein n=1 Tax=Methylophaga frappieri (strain ATCC BAA-2434 / DSM 25690 / JAM7) TaxID=754477 RepID=I1YG02_METFJ|nr:DUF2007 domain-containing protein [Methylophaga frappieri]AFJ01845.1 hypothetical protein Q7C_674 [Methylophaga frappieri]
MEIIFAGNTLLEAHIISGLLTANDIANHVSGHYLQGAVGDLPATDFAHVLIHDLADKDLALQLIEDYETGRLALTTPDSG